MPIEVCLESVSKRGRIGEEMSCDHFYLSGLRDQMHRFVEDFRECCGEENVRVTQTTDLDALEIELLDFVYTMSQKCSWCNKVKALLPGKRYCERCDLASFQECRRCRHSLDHAKYFTSDPSGSRCNACQRKFLLERAMATTSKQSGSTKTTIMLSLDSEIGTLSEEADESCGEFKMKSVVKKAPVKRQVVFKRQQP